MSQHVLLLSVLVILMYALMRFFRATEDVEVGRVEKLNLPNNTLRHGIVHKKKKRNDVGLRCKMNLQ